MPTVDTWGVWIRHMIVDSTRGSGRVAGEISGVIVGKWGSEGLHPKLRGRPTHMYKESGTPAVPLFAGCRFTGRREKSEFGFLFIECSDVHEAVAIKERLDEIDDMQWRIHRLDRVRMAAAGAHVPKQWQYGFPTTPHEAPVVAAPVAWEAMVVRGSGLPADTDQEAYKAGGRAMSLRSRHWRTDATGPSPEKPVVIVEVTV